MRDSDSRKKRIRCRLLSLGGLGLLVIVGLAVLSVYIRHRNPPAARVAPQQVRQKAAVAPGVGTPNDPIAKKVETAADGGDAEPPAQTATDIDLPAPLIDDKNVNLMLARLSNEQYWKAEDKVAQSWPKLDDLRAQLVRELRAQFDLEKMTARELVQHAVDLREKFWQSGGRMSPNSFTELYRARVLLELGHQRYPDDVALTDELVETIQSGWPHLTYNSPPPMTSVSVDQNGKPGEPGSYMGFDQTTMSEIVELREKQSAVRQRQFQEGQPPEFQDFLRLYDLSVLYRYLPVAQREANRARADQIVKWLVENADRGGWSYYRANLERLRENWAAERGYDFTIFRPRNRKGEQAAQYGRRLPSFRGAQSRDLVAVKDVFTGNTPGRAARLHTDGSLEIVERQ
jgi:hypothetical protein